MDGSKRSSHGNAFFTGFGAAKRIVLFDTLVSRLAPAGGRGGAGARARALQAAPHREALALSAAVSFACLWLLGQLIDQPWFYAGLGVATPGTAAALLAVRAGGAGVHCSSCTRSPAAIRASTSSRPTPTPRSTPSAADLVRGAGQALPGQRRHPDAGPAAFGVLRFAPARRDAHRPTEDRMTRPRQEEVQALRGRRAALQRRSRRRRC